jgi:GTP-binding protein Era
MSDITSEQTSGGVTRCGYAAIVGRPNVGKSTLLNHVLGQKISITSRKPQTTRHNMLGIKTEAEHQIIFVDTPGMHLGQDKAINRYMNRSASTAIRDVDVVVFVVDRCAWTEEDEAVARRLENSEIPVLIALNKVDQLDDKESILPQIEQLMERVGASEIVPISALRGNNLDALEREIVKRLPESDHFFPEDQITDRSSRFIAAEMVREKITRQLGDELPYQMNVEIEEFSQQGEILHIGALILVERDGQKRILIGNKGDRIKQIGIEARGDMEELFGCKVMLRLWVKVKSGWSDDERALRSLGYDNI